MTGLGRIALQVARSTLPCGEGRRAPACAHVVWREEPSTFGYCFFGLPSWGWDVRPQEEGCPELPLNDLFPSPLCPTEAPLQGYSALCLVAEIAHLPCRCLLIYLPNALLYIDSP